MGQIKNIKLHIVTDIKGIATKTWVQRSRLILNQLSLRNLNQLAVASKRKRNGQREKLNNAILFDKPTYEKLIKEVPSYKLITPSVVSERLKVRASLARTACDELVEKGLIKAVDRHHAQRIYTRATKAEE